MNGNVYERKLRDLLKALEPGSLAIRSAGVGDDETPSGTLVLASTDTWGAKQTERRILALLCQGDEVAQA